MPSSRENRRFDRMQTVNAVSSTATTLGGLIVPQVTGDERANDPSLVKVLHVINGEFFAGAERVQQILGKRLNASGIDPLFAIVKPGEFREQSRLRRYQMIDCPMNGRFDFAVATRLARLAIDKDCQLLHAHTPRTALVTGRAATQAGLPWVYHVHSPATRDSTRGIINRINAIIEKRALKTCDLVITVSKSLRREMLLQGVPREKLAVVANGVARGDAIARRRYKKWRLGLVALMRPRKGVEVALRSLRNLRDQDVPVELELIGTFETPEYEQRILSLIDELQLQSSVTCSGFTSDIPSAMHRLDCLLLPSLFGEGMPMVVLEAIANAVPVIASKVEGTPEVIRDGVEGFLAEPGCSESLANCIRKLVSSREQWQQLSDRAHLRHQEKFSDVAMAQAVARAYRKVLDA